MLNQLIFKGRSVGMNNFDIKYFLASNSSEGFVSVFGESFCAKDGWRCFIIKGGPGTGKSSFMKYIASKAAIKDMEIHLCPCSSDPDSLDAIILPQKKIIVLDGTAPHTLDPIYPAVCEEILNFGAFWDTDKIKQNSSKIISVTDANKLLHKTASKYLRVAGQMTYENYKTALLSTDLQKAKKYAMKLCKKYIPKRDGEGKEKTVFLNAVTPKGVVSFTKTALLMAENPIIIEDRFGTVSNEICKIVREEALAGGYNIITVRNALLPSVIIDHVIIPELSIAFLREYDFAHFGSESRRIHARRFTNVKSLSKNREKLKFNKKVSKELLLEAIATLQNAKTVHDKLEEYYVDAMDFEALTLFAKDFCQEILK